MTHEYFIFETTFYLLFRKIMYLCSHNLPEKVTIL